MNLNPFKKGNPSSNPAQLPILTLPPQAMTQAMLPDILGIEQTAYSHPWSLINFTDALASGYHTLVWRTETDILCYLVAMRGADEVHLLNFTVAPSHQRRGLARHMMQYLSAWSQTEEVHAIWLEVRAGNQRAIDIYTACGFSRDGVRPGYYPAQHGIREDAVVMSLSW
jgi:ribosomal-protein-alanine N-acetyltransferase